MSPAQPTPTLATDTHPNQHCRPQAEHCLVVIHDTHINNIANITLDEWRPGRPGYLRETACAELLRIPTTVSRATSRPRGSPSWPGAVPGGRRILICYPRPCHGGAVVISSSSAGGVCSSVPLLACCWWSFVKFAHFLRFYPFSVRLAQN